MWLWRSILMTTGPLIQGMFPPRQERIRFWSTTELGEDDGFFDLISALLQKVDGPLKELS